MEARYANGQNWVLSLLSRLGAVISDSHVVYSAGRHGSAYINKDALYPHVQETSKLCSVIARHFRHHIINTVVAPAVGGVILSQWVAHHLGSFTDSNVCSVYAEKEMIHVPETELFSFTGNFKFGRGYERFVSGKRVLVVEDVLTSGKSAQKVVEAVNAVHGNVVGVAAICNRGGVTAEQLGVPELFSLVNIQRETWPPGKGSCPLCDRDIPINTQVGHGKSYLEKMSSS